MTGVVTVTEEDYAVTGGLWCVDADGKTQSALDTADTPRWLRFTTRLARKK